MACFIRISLNQHRTTCISKMTKHLFDNILKTKAIRPNLIYALNGCSVGLAFVLIFLELQTFLIKKPTSTEQTTRDLNFRIAPQILFCLQPAFKLETLNSLGYNGKRRNHFLIKSYFLFQALSSFSLGTLIKPIKVLISNTVGQILKIKLTSTTISPSWQMFPTLSTGQCWSILMSGMRSNTLRYSQSFNAFPTL